MNLEHQIHHNKCFTHLVQFIVFLSLFNIVSCKNHNYESYKYEQANNICLVKTNLSSIEDKPNGDFTAKHSSQPVQIDGCGNDQIWSDTNWYGMNYMWIGKEVDTLDYHGKFKLAWDRQFLYILVEIMDDTLHPTLNDGIENYWKGDYVEIFIDEDKSGGDHKFNHQAFAYHISTEGHAIDQSTQQQPIFLDDHIKVSRTSTGSKHLWEIAIQLYDDDFDDQDRLNNKPLTLTAQKLIGFSIAYGDNDGNKNRENFIGSKKSHGNNNDDGYINADVFGSVLFIK